MKLYEIAYNNEGDVQKNSESNDPLYKTNKRETLKEIMDKFKEWEKSKEKTSDKSIEDIIKENDKGKDKLLYETIKKDIIKEIADILREQNKSNKDKNLIIIVACIATITLIIGGFFLYRFIRRKNTSNQIENVKDLVRSENN